MKQSGKILTFFWLVGFGSSVLAMGEGRMESFGTSVDSSTELQRANRDKIDRMIVEARAQGRDEDLQKLLEAKKNIGLNRPKVVTTQRNALPKSSEFAFTGKLDPEFERKREESARQQKEIENRAKSYNVKLVTEQRVRAGEDDRVARNMSWRNISFFRTKKVLDPNGVINPSEHQNSISLSEWWSGKADDDVVKGLADHVTKQPKDLDNPSYKKVQPVISQAVREEFGRVRDTARENALRQTRLVLQKRGADIEPDKPGKTTGEKPLSSSEATTLVPDFENLRTHVLSKLTGSLRYDVDFIDRMIEQERNNYLQSTEYQSALARQKSVETGLLQITGGVNEFTAKGSSEEREKKVERERLITDSLASQNV